MQFALNYSPQAASLLDAGALDIDRFKCPDWPDLIAAARAYRPVYVHFELRTDRRHLTAETLDAAARWRDETSTPYINAHIIPARGSFLDMPVDTADPGDERAVFECLLDGAAALVERFGAEHVIIENVPYYGRAGETPRPAVLPDTIRRVVEETGCGFLLDISHARLAARHLGMDEAAYLGQMPGERLREIHVTGIGRDPDGRVCDHLALTGEDWRWVGRVLDRVRAGEWAAPWAMAFEYGGIGPLFEWRSERDVIAAQVPRLVELAHAV